MLCIFIASTSPCRLITTIECIKRIVCLWQCIKSEWHLCDNYTFIFCCDIFKIFSSGKRTSSRLRDPEVAAKHKAFLHKVNVATNGSMDSYLKASQLGETSNCIREGGLALDKEGQGLQGYDQILYH